MEPVETIFQKIIQREIPATIIYEDQEVLAFRDINPASPSHVLIIPKKPIPSLREITPDDAPLLGKMLLAASSIAEQEGINEDGYRVVINAGQNGGQTVYHLHMHLLGGRAMHWPPG